MVYAVCVLVHVLCCKIPKYLDTRKIAVIILKFEYCSSNQCINQWNRYGRFLMIIEG